MLNRLITFRTDSTEITDTLKSTINFNQEDIKVIFVKNKKQKRTKEEKAQYIQKSNKSITSILRNNRRSEVTKEKKVIFADTLNNQLAEIHIVPSYKQFCDAPPDNEEDKSSHRVYNKCKWSCLII